MRNKRKSTISRIYKFIKFYIGENGYNPTYSHISKTLNLSEGTISSSIDYLVQNGYLKNPKWAVIQLTEKEFDYE